MKKEYALYKGDKFIDIGTKKYLAELLNVDITTIEFYSTPSYKKRLNNRKSENAYIVVKIEGDD